MNRTAKPQISTTISGSRVILISLLLICIIGILVVSCSPQPVATPTATSEISSVLTPTPDQTPMVTGLETMTIWIADDFSPNHQVEALQLINSRVEVFRKKYPENPVEIRLMHDLLNRLSLTSRAAPSALPNLILVDQQTLEIAALKGLLQPIPMDGTLFDESKWLPEIIQTGKIQDTQFGLPVVGDSLILFRKDTNQIIPDLDTLISSGDRVSVDLADQDSSLALSIYLSLGGSVEDGNGRPMLDEAPLRSTLDWFRKGRESGSISREQNIDPGKDLIWSRFANGNLKWWIGWYSDVPSSAVSNSKESKLPAIQGEKIMSISDGWYWAFPNPDPDQKKLSDELVEIYTQSEFLNEIAALSGWLPVIPDQVQENLILSSTQMKPDGLILVTIAQILQDSVLRVLMGESPELVAQQAVELIN